jgi:hypothetical protein
MRRRSLGVMSTTWMKKDVSRVVVDECRLLNTSFHALADCTISCKVPIWNWLQSLSVSVQMDQISHQALSFLAKNFTQNGFR